MRYVVESCVANILEKVSLAELRGYRFSPGDVFWVKKSGHNTKLLSAGEVINNDYLKRFDKDGIDIQINSSINIDVISKGKILFLGLKNSVFEEQRVLQRKKILSFIKSIYWDGEQSGSILDLVILFENVFYNFDDDVSGQLFSSSVALYQRGAIMGAMQVVLALSCGYLSFDFLKDLYNLSYLFDYGIEGGPTFNIMMAHEKDRVDAGVGLDYLWGGKDSSDKEGGIYLKHSFNGVKSAQKGLKVFFKNSKMLELITFHHERADGCGFPLAASSSELSDLELLVIFVNRVTQYDEFSYSLDDGVGYFKKIMNLKYIKNSKIKTIFEGVMIDIGLE